MSGWRRWSARLHWRPRARTRLTLWYSALMAATLLLLGSLALVAVERALYASLDESLRARALTLEQAVGHELEEGEHRDGDGDGEFAAQAIGLDVLRVWDQRGRLVFGRDEAAMLNPSTSRAPGPAGSGVITSSQLRSGTVVRLLTHPLHVKGKTVGVVQLGKSVTDIERALASLRLLGLSGAVLALALAAAGGAFLAQRALAPVDAIAREAEAIGADDLSRRLGLDLPDDEIGRLARAFDGMLARLESAFERQRRFTADASHELRTPLGIMRTEIDVALANPRRPDEYVQVLRDVRTENARIMQLVERLLLLARADGPSALTLIPVDLQDIVAEAGVSVTSQARQRGIRLAVALDDTSDILGDPVWLRQLLLNLLENALRHTPAGGQVSLALRNASGGVEVCVSDTGPGIAPEHLPHLFERFYRADDARDRDSGGAGLGLAICEWVARAHQGRLTITSKLGAGATFTVWLPATASGAATDGSDASAAAERRAEEAGAPA